MKTKFPYKIVKVSNAEECCDKVKMLESEILQATDFIKNREQGNLEAELAFNVHNSQLDKDGIKFIPNRNTNLILLVQLLG